MNVTVQPNCADVPLRICSLTHLLAVQHVVSQFGDEILQECLAGFILSRSHLHGMVMIH